LALKKLPVKLSAGEMNALSAPDGGGLGLPSVEAGQLYVRTAVLNDLKRYMQSESANVNLSAAV
jgi:hypothetical protein